MRPPAKLRLGQANAAGRPYAEPDVRVVLAHDLRDLLSRFVQDISAVDGLFDVGHGNPSGTNQTFKSANRLGSFGLPL